jgi:hypothetical protein
MFISTTLTTIHGIGKMELKVRYNGKNVNLKGKSKELASFVKQLFNESQTAQPTAPIDPNMPSVEQIVAFLEEQENFNHTLHTVMIKFFKRIIDSRKERTTYDHLYRRVDSARQYIMEKYNGVFDKKPHTEMDGEHRAKPITLYIFQRQKVETAK